MKENKSVKEMLENGCEKCGTKMIKSYPLSYEKPLYQEFYCPKCYNPNGRRTEIYELNGDRKEASKYVSGWVSLSF